MLVTLLVLTTATALGIFASYAVTTEIRTAGTVRVATQAEYVADISARLGRELASQYVPHMGGEAAVCPEGETDTLYLQDFITLPDNAFFPPLAAPEGGETPFGQMDLGDLLERPAMQAGEQLNGPNRPVECRFRMTASGSMIGTVNPALGMENPTMTTQRMRAFMRTAAQ